MRNIVKNPRRGRTVEWILAALFLLPAGLMLHAGNTAETVWKTDFSKPVTCDGSTLPENWRLDGKKTFVPMPQFYLSREDGRDTLNVKSNLASGAAVTLVKADLRKYPFLRWKWRVLSLPENGDGRNAKTDDQAIVIYLGAGPVYSRKSVSYRWETEPPVGTEGNVRYGGGLVKVFYRVMRNKDNGLGKWHTESVNILADFQKQYGFIPDEFVISVGANSQYTKSNTHAQLSYIELSKTP